MGTETRVRDREMTPERMFFSSTSNRSGGEVEVFVDSNPNPNRSGGVDVFVESIPNPNRSDRRVEVFVAFIL